MKRTVTFGAILESGHWEDFCIKYGINEWILNEGIAEENDTIAISLEDAEDWGIIYYDLCN